MDWPFIWANVVQPVLFFGLFIMTFIGMMISLKGFKRQLKEDECKIDENQRKIIDNTRQIQREHKLLLDAITKRKSLRKLRKVLKEDRE